MPRLNPADGSQLESLQPLLEMVKGVMGFVPNSFLAMARKPAILQAFAGLAMQVLSAPDAEVEPELKQLIAHMASSAAGCKYCMAHTAHSAAKSGSTERIDHLIEFATNGLFSEGERAALTLARDAAQVPNAVTDESFAQLNAFYSQNQIAEIVAVISLFGFLNRWNDTLATELEQSPLAFAEEHLGPNGWTVGKHKP